ncbi:hypothetical protein [Salmonirosea aquatica]|uniref:Uncharacterized protein n=1 Tax=Salmonirosea aquatica TaxID=2654236 RepID=A0A7C9FX69_9BACT|nr:hypothetical protein [Cytophagaceae bacterium SJW1-29]
MLTISINIEDEHLAQRLKEKAEANGKSVDQLVEESLVELFGEADRWEIEIPRLNVLDHARVINNTLTAEEEEALAQNPDVKPFSHIDDPAKYIHDLRRKPRY